MSAAPYVELFATLRDAQARYAVVGGLAVVLHGVPRMTFDLDLAVDPSDDNMAAFVEALNRAGYHPRVPEPLERLADPVVRKQWRVERNMIAFNVHHPVRRLEDVDVLLLDHDEWTPIGQSVSMKALGGVAVPVVGRAALIAMKRASGPPQDLADADALEHLGKERADG